MKKTTLKIIIALMLSVVMLSFVACNDAQESEETNAPTATQAPAAGLTGEISVSGSTSVEKVGVALGDEFMALNPGVDFTYEGIGSSGGVKNANDATTMLGTASRNIKDSEKEWGMTEKVLAYDGIAVIVNPENSIAELTVEQVQKIYLGEITNWSQVGGEDAEIAVISREDGSGTRGAFEEIVDFEDALRADALIKDGNGNVQATVAETPLAIGYVSFTYVDETVKGVLIGGAEPTVENVLNGSYAISRPFNIVYHEENLSDAAKAFLTWIDTAEAKEIIAEKGAIPLSDDMSDSTEEPAMEVSGEITVSGSTSVEPVGVALGDEFMALYPDVDFTYQGIGSSGGVKNANDATTMLGTASRNIKDSEKEWGMTEKVLAYDGIAVIVNPANGVSDLTVEQVQKIYLGEITNWSQVGGEDAEIAVISREDGSGTRGAFEEIVEFEDALRADALIKDGNGNVQATVAETPLAIGYVSFTYLDETVKGVLIGGAEPTVENVLNGSYAISRPFNIVYHEENLTDAAKAFLAWIDTAEAKEIIAEKGAIPLADDMSAEAEDTFMMPESLEGEISVSGSTSVEKVGVALGDEFMALFPDVDFTYEGIGSSGGVKNANDATTMLGTASRNIKDSEKEWGMTEQVLAYDGIAIIVHPSSGLMDLTVEQARQIYTGEITNWSELGLADAEIAVISREDGSGTRGAFEEIVGFEDELRADAIIKDGNGNVQATVAGNELAIGYVSFTYLDDTVKGVIIEGALPTVENVLNNSYKISRPFNIVYHEANLTEAAKVFLKWVNTDEAKEIIAEKGAIPLD